MVSTIKGKARQWPWVQQRVFRCVHLLNATCPGWTRYLDPVTLDLASDEDSIEGQLRRQTDGTFVLSKQIGMHLVNPEFSWLMKLVERSPGTVEGNVELARINLGILVNQHHSYRCTSTDQPPVCSECLAIFDWDVLRRMWLRYLTELGNADARKTYEASYGSFDHR